MEGVFHCKGCGAAITGKIEVLSLKDPSVEPPSFKEQEPVASPGTAYKSYDNPYFVGDWSEEVAQNTEPKFWLNPDDVKPFSRYIKKRCIGCCGIAGTDGPNHECANCGTEIGTEESDCYTPYVFSPLNKNTEFKRSDK